jgi:bifunctional non-homologous end joining protein LigD
VSWDDVDDGASGKADLVFEAADVLDRVATDGDLFAAVLELEQPLPSFGR